MDEITVHISYYDDSTKQPEEFKVLKDTTANQLYDIVTDKYPRCKFELYNDDDNPVEHSDKPITEIFKDEVNLQLIKMNDGASVDGLISHCLTCPLALGEVCGQYNDLTKETIIMDIITEVEDAWLIFSEIYQLTDDVRDKIKENCEGVYVRCIDVIHHLYHVIPLLLRRK